MKMLDLQEDLMYHKRAAAHAGRIPWGQGACKSPAAAAHADLSGRNMKIS